MSEPRQPGHPEQPGHRTPAGYPEQTGAWGTPRSKVVTWYDQAATVAGGAGLTGLEFMQALRDGRIPPPHSRLMTPSARRLRSPVAALFGVAGQGPGLGVQHLGYVTGPRDVGEC